MLARLGGAAAPCADGACAVRRVAAAPGGWGSEEMPDGLGAAERWPAGAARLLGSFGSALEAPPPGTHAVEPSPIAIGRGALAWAGGVGAASSDGPFLLLALAPMPHLGVSHTVYPPPPPYQPPRPTLTLPRHPLHRCGVTSLKRTCNASASLPASSRRGSLGGELPICPSH